VGGGRALTGHGRGGEGSAGHVWVVPVLALALAGVSWAAVLVRLAGAPASVTAFWRLTFSVVLVVPFLWLSGQWRQLAAIRRADGVWILVAGACLAFHFVTWFLSLEYTSVASSTVLVTAHPIFVGVLSARWLREPPRRLEWAGIGIAVMGAALVGWGDFRSGSAPLVGDALAFAAGGLAALYFVTGRRLRVRLGLWGYVFPVYLSAAVVAGGVVWITGAPANGYPVRTWWMFAALAVGPMLLGHTGFNWALRHVRAYLVSLVHLLEPIGATLIAVLVFGAAERPTWNTAIGGGVILGGVFLALRQRLATAPPLPRRGVS